MRTPILMSLVLLAACTGTSEPAREPVKVEFREEASTWALTPRTGQAGAETLVALQLAEQKLEFGAVPGTCAPSATVPFTEVQGQPSFAGLLCQSPDGGTHHAVLVEVAGEDPTWPAPVGLALVLTRTTQDDKVALMTLGMQELPLGVTPLAPKVQAAPADQAPSEPANGADGADGADGDTD